MHPDVIAATRPDHLAIVADGGAARTYEQLAASAWRIARLLRELGLQPGDHLALLMDNRPEMLEVLWGAHSAGLFYTACSTQATADELAYVINDCDASVIVASAALAERAAVICDATPKVSQRFSIGGRIDGHDALEEAIGDRPADPIEGALAGAPMLYSSGTTGHPKGVRPADERRPLHAPELFTGVMEQLLGFRAGDVYLSPAPLHHAAPLRGCMSIHRLGGTVVLMHRFDAEAVLALIEAHAVTHAQFVPTMFTRMLRLEPAVRARYDVSSLRAVVHAAAPCPIDIKRSMIEWWGPIIHEYYGATEGFGATWITSSEWLEHPGSVGRAVVGEAHILDDDGREVPVGETGTIYFAGGPSFEYHAAPEQTADAHNATGWATVGDVGHLDADGYLYLTDRRAHLIITGGVNVYPQETENVLATHPRVLDAAVFGVPDEDLGEQVTAVVQPVEMPGDSETAERMRAELIAHCRSRLAGYKCPRRVDFRTELPRHDTGKLYKRLLIDEYAGRRP